MCRPSLIGVADRCSHAGGTPVGRGGGRLAGRLDGHVGDEPVSATVHRANEPLAAPVVTHRPTCLLDAARHGCFGDEPPAPHGVHELFLGHHPVPMGHKVGQHVEGLRLHAHGPAVSTQLEQGRVKHKAFVERQPHVTIVARRTRYWPFATPIRARS